MTIYVNKNINFALLQINFNLKDYRLMKSILRFFAVVTACVAIALPASAQLSFGVKAGAKINSLSFDSKAFESENRAGFTGGLMAEFTVPVIGVGVDASVMYVHSTTKANVTGTDAGLVDESKSYIEVPVNLKWKIGVPIVGKIVSPYIFTGPSFSFLAGKDEINAALKQKKVDMAWNLGVGVQLFSKVQVGASYGWGLNNTLEVLGADGNWTDIKGKKNCWTVTAAYLF